MLKWLKNILFSEDDNDPEFVSLLRNILIVILVILILLAISQTSLLTGAATQNTLITLLLFAFLDGVFIFLTTRKILWPGKIFLPALLLIILTYFITIENGLHDVSVIGYPLVILVSGLMQGRRALPFWAIATAVCIVFAGFWDMAGLTPNPVARTTRMDTIFIGVILILASTGIINILLRRFAEIIAKTRENEQKLISSNDELRTFQSLLEDRIADRTVELEKQQQHAVKRSRQFEGITQVSKAISAAKNLEQTLPNIAQLISEQFGFYHVGIFLNDPINEYSLLSAANSEGGRTMLARGHKLKIGEQGIVGYVTNTGEPRIALDVGDDAVFFNNPDLPLTHSEMALPLLSGQQVIGALDIQSTAPNAFSKDDIEVLASLADQVALAIQNARLFDQTGKLLAEMNAIQRQSIRETWSNLPREKKLAGYRYSITGATPLDVFEDTNRKNPHKREFAVPISLRGEDIGTLTIQVPKDEKISANQIDLIKAVADRVALSAENARLFDETQKRATQLESLNEMGRVVSQQIELNAVLRAAYEQLRRVIQLDSYIVALYEKESQTVQFPFVIDDGEEFTSNLKSPLDPENATGKVITSGRSILDLLSESELASKVNSNTSTEGRSKIAASLMYLPLTVGQSTIGVLTIHSYTPNAYTQSQVTLVENIANQLSIAIQNARLFEEANKRAERERIITEITSKIGASVRTENILKTTARELNQLLDGAEVLIKLKTDNQ